MSKALVIKGANFLANRVEQISVSDPIPCTGIALSQNTIEFTQIGATATLVATLTPTDTTEALSWVSSDEDVATVSNGVVTCTGIGTATITAICGEQSAECAIASSMTIDMPITYHKNSTVRYSGSVDIANSKNWIGLVDPATNAWTFYSTENILGGYRAFIKTKFAGMYLMPIPNGTKTITANFPSVFNYSALIAANSNIKSAASGADGQCAAALKITRTSTNDGTARTMTLNISDVDANGFIFSAVASNESFDASTVTGDVTVTFS